jgi:hypothetical protein
MAHKNQEACQLFIEQEIQKGLDEGKTPYSIGKDLAVWIEKLFEASIPAKTLETQAYREKKKLTSNEVNLPTPPNHYQITGKQENPPLTPGCLPKYCGQANQMANLAISQLSRIMSYDPERLAALRKVKNWIEKQLKEMTHEQKNP